MNWNEQAAEETADEEVEPNESATSNVQNAIKLTKNRNVRLIQTARNRLIEPSG